MLCIIIDCDDKLRKRSEYVFETILNILGYSYKIFDESTFKNSESSIILFYGKCAIPEYLEKAKQKGIPLIHIPCHVSINSIKFNNNLIYYNNQENPNIASRIIHKKKELIPVFFEYFNISSCDGDTLFHYEDSGTAVLKNKNYFQFGFDIISSIFYLIGCVEERTIEKYDNKKRFKASFSKRNTKNLIKKPIVNIYIKIIEEIIFSCFKIKNIQPIRTPLWPNNKPFAACLTHDVDNIYNKGLYVLLATIARTFSGIFKREYNEIIRNIQFLHRSIFYRRNTFWNFEKWMALEEKYGVRSCFYFLGGQKKGRYGKRYDWKKLNNIITTLNQKGWEVGLHGSYYSFDNIKMLQDEKNKLEAIFSDKIYGNRQHYLRFNTKFSWNILEKTGFEYDTTLGYPDQIGYRAGIAFPFYPYNIENNRKHSILELPLIVLDSTLSQGKSINIEDTWFKIKNILDNTKKFNGFISLLFHQCILDDDYFSGWNVIYEKTLQYLKNNNAYVATGREITNWWKSRAKRIHNLQLL